MTRYLTIDDIMDQVDVLGFTVRDAGLLASAVARPGTTIMGEDVYPTLPHKIAALIDGVNRNHCLLDGNKRLSWVAAVLFAALNDQDLAATADDGDRMIRAVAAGEPDLDSLALWVEQRLTPRPSEGTTSS